LIQVAVARNVTPRALESLNDFPARGVSGGCPYGWRIIGKNNSDRQPFEIADVWLQVKPMGTSIPQLTSVGRRQFLQNFFFLHGVTLIQSRIPAALSGVNQLRGCCLA
jgi:hypothetical protein